MRPLSGGVHRVGALALGLGCATAAGLGLFSVWALAGIQRAEAARHEQVAERLFDAMETSLSELVQREEARSFLEYRTYYLPVGGGDLNATVRSPLADVPEGGPILGYFQVEPDGSLTLPSTLEPADLAPAMEQGWAPPSRNEVQAEVVVETVSGVDDWVLDNDAVQVPAKVEDRLNSLGVQRRSGRAEQQLQAPSSNVGVYQQKVVEPAPSAAVDVRVTPMVGQEVGGRLVLHRTVHVGGERYRQGLVIDRDRLGDQLQAEVLPVSGLEGSVDPWWNGAAPDAPSRRWRMEHEFGPPFQALTLALDVDPIPGVRSAEGAWLQGAVLAVFAMLLALAAALGLAVRAELVYAQRRSDFVAAVTHELKTPLTAIRMYAEMLRDGMVPDPARQRLYHDTITSESERLSRLIGNVLELSRMEQGLPRAEPVVGDVGPVLEEVAAMLAPHAGQQGVRLRVEVGHPLPPARIDRDALVQVLTNLVDNAMKFGGAGEVVIGARPASGGVEVTVRDHGPGVPAAQLPLIFDAFYRGERELTRSTRGTGIGLALVAGLVGDMGGRVVAANAAGGGLCVSVWLAAA